MVPPAPLGAPAAPPAAIAPPVPRTYRELYTDVASNPPPERTARYPSGNRFTDLGGREGVPTPAPLRNQTAVTLSDRLPMAFLALVLGQDDTYEVVVLRRILR